MSVNLVGRRVMGLYDNSYFVCGDVIESRVFNDRDVHQVKLVQPVNMDGKIAEYLILYNEEIHEAWVPDCMEV